MTFHRQISSTLDAFWVEGRRRDLPPPAVEASAARGAKARKLHHSQAATPERAQRGGCCWRALLPSVLPSSRDERDFNRSRDGGGRRRRSGPLGWATRR